MEVIVLDGGFRRQRLITVIFKTRFFVADLKRTSLFIRFGCQKSNFICCSVRAERRLFLIRESFLRAPSLLSGKVLILSSSERAYLAFFLALLQYTLKLSGHRPMFRAKFAFCFSAFSLRIGVASTWMFSVFNTD